MWEADTIPTDATIPIYDRDRVRVLGIGLVVGLGLVTLLQSSFIGTKSVGIASVGIVWFTHLYGAIKTEVTIRLGHT